MSHRFECRVYYEDTDLAGIVYYANYLRFIERARTEYVRSLGIDQAVLKAEQGIVFAVKSLTADYKEPARFDDVLSITTQPIAATAARVTLQQDVRRADTLLFTSEVTLVAMTTSGRPTRLPAALREAITLPGRSL